MPPTSRHTTPWAAITLVAVLCAAGTTPTAMAADAPDQADAQRSTPVGSAADKLGSDDAERLAEAEADGAKTVTMTIATAPGETDQAVKKLRVIKGGSLGRVDDRLGYVRATVPTDRAETAIATVARSSTVHAIDLRHDIARVQSAPSSTSTSARTASSPYPGPGKNTPAGNPYTPTHETGAVAFVEKHPKADGRGVTIGVLDTGVDPTTPALQKTTTGERKITDWVTSTDPITDGDATWRPMTTTVTGPAFTYGGQSWKAPAGSYGINVFKESATSAGSLRGDVNRDGDTTDEWGVLYDPKAGTVTVDTDGDHDFTDDKPMKPYKDGYRIGYFGTDDPSTPAVERVPFVVQIRKDVPTDPYGGDWVGKKADFVNIGLVSNSGGTFVSGLAAGNGLLGGRMNGAAPGAKIVSARACVSAARCPDTAVTEGLIDLVVNYHVDIVSLPGNMPPNSADAEIINRLIDTYKVQPFVQVGNFGPGANSTYLDTTEDPVGLNDKVVWVGGSVSRQTWAADYGVTVTRQQGLLASSARGPREDGGFFPTLIAPGAAVSTIPAWLPSVTVPAAGWSLPAGYAMYDGSSTAAAQAMGAGTLLLSAANEHGRPLSPAALRTALTSTARHVPGLQPYEEGAGLIDVAAAWNSVAKGATAHDYTVKAPVDTTYAPNLSTPGFGAGVYDREGGLTVGRTKTYDVVVTRASGPDRPVRHTLRLKNDTGHTFSLVGAPTVELAKNRPVTVRVRATPASVGIKSAILQLDDPATQGVDKQVMTTVVVSAPLHHTFSAAGSVQRTGVRPYFVTVPAGAKALQVTLGGLAKGSSTSLSAYQPFGFPATPADSGSRTEASFADPVPGVWEVDVQAAADSAVLDNPYSVRVTVLRADFSPDPATLAEVTAGAPAPVDWKVTNRYAPVDATLVGGPLGSSLTARPTIAKGATRTTTVDVPEGATSLDVAIGDTSDPAADLDLFVYDAKGNRVATSADADSEESVSLDHPAPGTYTIEVDAYDAPSGSTAYDYQDVFYSSALGTVAADGSAQVKLGTGDSANVTANVTARAAATTGRELTGELRLTDTRGSVAGVGRLTIRKVNG
ncbi:S8 family serine peptidase [Streptomyces sp. NPDC001663]|uniref:S8 family serine peptidase n=1 Tax=Streptomyces sp. NPDC001663 TaxID=3364597 RepID=UPI003683D9C4